VRNTCLSKAFQSLNRSTNRFFGHIPIRFCKVLPKMTGTRGFPPLS
jgi:hypothetical protein